MYVCRILASTFAEPSTPCMMMPAPSLLAEPSRPRAKYGLSAEIRTWQDGSDMVSTWIFEWVASEFHGAEEYSVRGSR